MPGRDKVDVLRLLVVPDEAQAVDVLLMMIIVVIEILLIIVIIIVMYINIQ